MNPGGAAPLAALCADTSPVRLVVNGTEHALQVEGDAKLLDVLRDQLGLTGTRFGCGQAQCGACHVLIDGRVQPACDTPMWAVDGHEVTSVEGLAPPRMAAALREAFVAEQAMQCGYCSSGMLINAAALLQRDPDPSDRAVRAALDGNLCRCGAHNRIVRAVLRTARSLREPSSP
jgi:nicotinate dehydrogenase subunit A